MKHCNPKENIPIYAISVIVLASPLSGYIFRGLTAYNNYFVAAIIVSALLAAYTIATIFSKNERDAVSISKIDILVGIFLLYSLLGIFILHKTSHEPLFYVKWSLLIMLYISARLIPILNTGRLLYLLVTGGLIQAIIVFAQCGGIISSLNGNFNITGTFTNPGHVAVYLSGSIVSAIILLRQNYKTAGKPNQILLSIFISILFTALCLCKSRTSFIALLAALVTISLQTNWFKNLTKVRKSTVIVIGLVLLLFAGVGSYHIRAKSADARILIWRVSTKLFTQAPLVGNGIESFKTLYMYKQAEYFSANPNSKYNLVANNHYQSFNEFIHLACEQGIVGLLLFLSIMGYALIKGKSLIVRPLLVWLLVSSCFLYTADIFPVIILFPIIPGISDSDHCVTYSGRGYRLVDTTTCFAALSILLGGILVYSTYHKDKYDAICKKLIQKDSFYNSEGVMTLLQHSNYDIIKRNEEFSLFFAKAAFNYIEPEMATKIIVEMTEYSITTSTMLCDLGILYQRQKLYSKAEKYYELAANMIPCRIMPNYLLFKLYVETEDYTNAHRMAKKILSQSVSITGSIVLRIRNEVKEWLNNSGVAATGIYDTFTLIPTFSKQNPNRKQFCLLVLYKNS